MTATSTRRRLSLAAVVAMLALTFTACGASGDDKAGSTTTTTAATTTTTEGTTEDTTTTTTTNDGGTTSTTEDNGSPTTDGSGSGARDAVKKTIVGVYKQMGMSNKQAKCAADYILDKAGDLSGSDLSQLGSMGQDLLKKCDIDPTQLKLPNSLGGN